MFFAFSTFVMGALAQLPPAHGVAAMQRIDVVVLNPAFLGVFVGTAVLEGLIALLAVFGWDPAQSPLLLAGAALYVAGCFGVTMASQRPAQRAAPGADRRSRADRARVLARSTQREWTRWNHVRTVAALAAAACGIVALIAW